MSREHRHDFSSLYASTLAPLRRYLARLLGSPADAEDIAHDAFKRVYEAMDLKWLEHPRSYLFTTARRLALNQIEHKSHQAHPREDADNVIEFTPSSSPGIEQVVMAREEWQRTEDAISRLPLGCRKVLLMCEVDRLSHAEIAKTLNLSVSTIEKHHARALRLLRKSMAEPVSSTNFSAEEPDAAGGLR